MKKILFSLLCILFVGEAIAQTYISGNITDESGDPVPGATIMIKETSAGIISDIDGNYSIKTDLEEGTLEYSFLGKKTEQRTFNRTSTIDVVLVDDVFGLDEVVAIGYGTIKKKDLTGAVSSVKADIIQMAPATNAIEALQGRVAGVDITRSSGKAGSSIDVLIRGNRSITGGHAPLYIIDGIPGSVSSLNPNDIETIDVLKDASSKAIYGVGGSNGVIIITTKQAKKGKVKIDVDSYVGVNKWESYPRPLQGNAWLTYLEEKFYAAKGVHSTTQDELLTANNIQTDLYDPYIQSGKWVDWVDETLHTGIQQNYNISIRGGSEKTQSYFSLGYRSEKGIYKNDRADYYTMRAGVTHELTKWAKAGIQSTLLWSDRDSRSSRINKTFSTIPLGDVYDEDGNINPEPIEGSSSTVSLLADDVPGVMVNNSKQIRTTINPFLEIQLIDGLTFKTVLGTTLSASRNGVFENENTYMKLVGSSNSIKNASYNTGIGYGYVWDNIINYKKTFAENHNFGVTAIYEFKDSQSESSSAYNEGFEYNQVQFYDLSGGSNPSVGSDYSQRKKESYAMRLNYDYKGKYLFTATNRWDGSSVLAEKWDYFPAGSFGWRISEEPFMQNASNWLSNFKLRVGYGVTASDQIPSYVSTAGIQSFHYNLSLGNAQSLVYVPSINMTNPNLAWEKTYGTNIGFDIGLLKNRIDLVVELYNEETDGVHLARPIPTVQGAYDAKRQYLMYDNIAYTNNKGIEITLNTRNIDTKNFKWNSTITFAKNKEKIESIDLGEGFDQKDLIGLNLFIGKPIDALYGYNKTGIWQTEEAEEAAKYGRVPGDIKIETVEKFADEEDENGDGDLEGDGGVHEYSDADKQYLGSRTPDWSLGFQNSFYWKNFDLNIYAYARWGHLINADILGYFGRETMPETYDYWTETNPTNDYPRPSLKAGNNDEVISSLNIVDGSFIKIKNITLGYTLPGKLGSKLGIDKCRLYGTVTNPFIFTKSDLLEDVDPETGGSDSFPLYKQVVFGVNLSF